MKNFKEMLQENVKSYQEEQEQLKQAKEQKEYEQAKKDIEEKMVKIQEEIVQLSREGKTTYSFVVIVKMGEYNPIHLWKQAFEELGLEVKVKLNAYSNLSSFYSSDFFNPFAIFEMNGGNMQYRVIVKW